MDVSDVTEWDLLRTSSVRSVRESEAAVKEKKNERHVRKIRQIKITPPVMLDSSNDGDGAGEIDGAGEADGEPDCIGAGGCVVTMVTISDANVETSATIN